MKAESKTETVGFGGAAIRAGRAILIAAAVAAILLAASSLLLTVTSLPETAVPAIALATLAVGSLLAGFLAARQIGSRGLLCGAAVGATFVALVCAVASLAWGVFATGAYPLTQFAIGAAAGSFGGILGVNVGNRKR